MPKFVPLQTKQTLSFMTFEGNTLQAIYSMMSERNHNTKKNIPMNLYNSTYRPFLTIFSVSTFSKCRKIGHKTNMVQRLNSLNTPYHTVLERGFWIIATNVKYDTNRLKNESLCSFRQRWSALCHTYIDYFSSFESINFIFITRNVFRKNW